MSYYLEITRSGKVSHTHTSPHHTHSIFITVAVLFKPFSMDWRNISLWLDLIWSRVTNKPDWLKHRFNCSSRSDRFPPEQSQRLEMPAQCWHTNINTSRINISRCLTLRRKWKQIKCDNATTARRLILQPRLATTENYRLPSLFS